MTDGLSRRDVMMTAGAGLIALDVKAEGGSGLQQRAVANQSASSVAELNRLVADSRNHGALVEILQSLRGLVKDEHYGRDPHDVTPDDPDNWEAFNPSYIAILYLKLASNWELAVNHACFTLPANSTDLSRRIKAVQILTAKGTKNLGHDDLLGYGTYPYRLPHANHQPGKVRDSEWFNDFNFATQNELFIYIDNANILLEPGDLIAFKLFGIGSTPKYPNYSYFNAREVPQTESGLPGKLIRVKNYMTKEDGTLISSVNENRWYSMNIKFRVRAGSAGLITMLIDPDTGNGQGHEP
ncbi:MAG TPA: hypothetical protein VIT45_06280 [Allosphingosinicella sp.]